jgi:hypothetical protein
VPHPRVPTLLRYFNTQQHHHHLRPRRLLTTISNSSVGLCIMIFERISYLHTFVSSLTLSCDTFLVMSTPSCVAPSRANLLCNLDSQANPSIVMPAPSSADAVLLRQTSSTSLEPTAGSSPSPSAISTRKYSIPRDASTLACQSTLQPRLASTPSLVMPAPSRAN